MTEAQIAAWADLLAGYCLRVAPGEAILVAAEHEAWSLAEATARAVILRGGHPMLRRESPALDAFFLEHASDEQLGRITEAERREAESIDGEVRIKSLAARRPAAAFDARRTAIRDRARASLRHVGKSASRWVVTQFPTPAYAEFAGMSPEDYEDFVARAMFLDRADPAEAWVELGRRQAGLAAFMAGVRTVRIEAEGTDLTLDVAGRTWINSDGRRNMPSGEIFTGPVETSARGRLHCSFPVLRGGRSLSGIALEFADGVVTSARADEGGDYLAAMLDLDDGARRLGELGIGLNAGIDRFTGSILFDEKIGGTVHLALGQSYPETGGTNKSALHWDLIVDLRTQGRVTADGVVVMEDGRWKVG